MAAMVLAWLTDGQMPIMVSFLLPILQKNGTATGPGPFWGISTAEESAASSAVFVGMFPGSLFWGLVSLCRLGAEKKRKRERSLGSKGV